MIGVSLIQPALGQTSKAGSTNAAQAATTLPKAIPTTPIIDDKTFDAALPAINTDPAAPMGSVKDWEASQAALARSRASAKPAPGVTGGGQADAMANASALPPPEPVDPDLARPLIPLAGFDAEPLVTTTGNVGIDKPAAELHYRYQITGLEQIADKSSIAPIDGETIRSQFVAVSALQEGKGKAANGAMIAARLQQDQKTLADVLTSQGYYDASVHGSAEMPEQGEAGEIKLVLDVAPGTRYALGSVRFDAPPVTPSDLITKGFIPTPGEPIVAERILSAEANIGIVLPQAAYPFVKLGQRDILLDAALHKGDYTLPVTPGPRSRFGDIVVRGKKAVFAPAHIATIARFKKGELYDSRKIDDLRKALVATNLYSVVAVTPEPSHVSAGDGTEYATLAVDQQAAPPRSLSAQLGYSTGEGIKAIGSWTHANLFPPEGALIVGGTAGTNEQGLSGTFRRSNAGRRDRTVELGISALHSNLAAYEAFTGGLKGRISYASTPIWQKRLTYSYGFELVGSNEKDYDFVSQSERQRTFFILALPGQVTYDRSNSLLDPTRGFRFSAALSPESSVGSGGQVYVRGSLGATGYYPLGDRLVLAGRALVGSIAGAAREAIAPSRRLYSGGGGSVRGFGYQQLGPKDPNGKPIGGLSQVEASTEMRYRFGNYGLAAFVDAGQVYTSSLPSFNDWRFGAGIGARYYTNFGPLRLDIATPIHRRIGESRFSVYVSIGQAF